MHNNRKPMCQLGTQILGTPRTVFVDSKCGSTVKPVMENKIEPQFATFKIEAAQTSLYTRRSYVIKANFKTSSGVPDHPIWENYRPPSLQVRHYFVFAQGKKFCF